MEHNIFYEYIILVPSIAFILGVFLKGIFLFLKEGKIDFDHMFGSGGMPSVHSAVVTSLTTAIGLKLGVHSDLFALALGFSSIIIYDAINIRYEAGQHAVVINKFFGEKFKEKLGHLPSEAFVGSCLGIGVAFFLYYV